MNREIKFRAWNSTEKLMGLVTELEGSNSGYRFHRVTMECFVNGGQQFCSTSEFELLRFTGITDKNGVEIYEGDIVNHEKWISIGNYSPCIGVVVFVFMRFAVRCCGDWGGSYADLNSNAEVIGNIYQDKHLLQ